MLKRIVKNRVRAYAKPYGYDATYMTAIVDADLGAFRKLARAMGLGEYRKDLPRDPWFAAKIVGAMHEDCGACTQLVVVMAERAGVPARVVRAVVAGDDPALPEEVLRVVRFARASLAHDLAADEHRAWIVARWGERAVISIAFALAIARMYPTIKYAMGYGRACSRVLVGGAPVIPLGRLADPIATCAVVHA